ncbi:MAG TPA: PHB depolymerase family esterase [Candidatus Acidoferrales bacterium]|nr:PHB depolymerase family esterase [Candidatus Acidoferrales bacterium]
MKQRIAYAAALGLAATLCACSGAGSGSGSSVLPASTQHRAAAQQSLPSLGHYNVNLDDVVVAGVSSGADMATQLHFSYSANIKAEAIFAGSPFFCALGTSDAYWGLVYGPTYSADYALYSCSGTEYWSEGESPPLGTLETDTNNAAKDGYLDPVADLSGSKAWIFSGEDDTVVSQSVVKDSNTMLEHYGVSTTTNYTTAAEHGWVTPDTSNACGTLNSQYLINCGFDAEDEFLTDFFGTLNARNDGTLSGSLIEFDQAPYAAAGMDSVGYVYVPANCASGAACKLVVALHGCEQGEYYVGTAFVTESGLNEWADTNSIIVLYPQAIPSTGNTLGCWDWWDYTGTAYASNEGPQVEAIWKMIEQI